MKGYLSNRELWFYCFVTVVLYITMMYNVQSLSNSRLKYYNSMSDGWKILNRKVDHYDVEWQVFKELLGNYWYWFLIHILCTEVLRFLRFKSISLLHFIIGLTACLHMYNMRFFLALLLQALVNFGVSSVSKKKSHIWILTSISLIVLNTFKYESFFITLKDAMGLTEAKAHDFLVIFAWCILKNTSFSLEKVASEINDDNFSLINCLGFVFYTPTFHCGPTFTYTRYTHMLSHIKIDQSYSIALRVKQLILQLLRFGCWYIVIEIGLHFFYINYITMSMNLGKLNTFALFGLGFLNGQFFNIKYIIQYGVPITLGEFEHIPMPNKPVCICRVHKYSDMWKKFDGGLYEFLFKYIYTQMTTRSSSKLRKIFASSITFFFIYIWHGFFEYILIWSAANLACIVIEKLVFDYIESDNFKMKALSIIKTEENLHRLRAYVGVHILIPAILSNFFFFGGTAFGIEFIRRTYMQGMLAYLKISGTIFLLYPLSEAIKRYEQSNVKNKQYIF